MGDLVRVGLCVGVREGRPMVGDQVRRALNPSG